MNAISLLQKDHRTVEGIFDQLEKLKGDGPSRRKKELCERLVRELSIHSAIEEMIFYPEVKKAIAEAKEIVLESLEEHNVIKWELDAIQSSKVADAHLDAKIKVLKDAVMRHVDAEEHESLSDGARTGGSLEAGRHRQAPRTGQENRADATAPPSAQSAAGQRGHRNGRVGGGPRDGRCARDRARAQRRACGDQGRPPHDEEAGARAREAGEGPEGARPLTGSARRGHERPIRGKGCAFAIRLRA